MTANQACSFYHQLLFAQHHTIGADSPVIVLSQVGENDLHSGSSLVKVSCNLVSLSLVIGSHSTDENGHGRSDSISKVPRLKVRTRDWYKWISFLFLLKTSKYKLFMIVSWLTLLKMVSKLEALLLLFSRAVVRECCKQAQCVTLMSRALYKTIWQ